VAAAPLASRLLGRDAGWLLSLPLLASAGMGASTYSTGQVHTESVRWMPTIDVNFSLRLDGLSLVFLMLVLVVGVGVLAYPSRYLHHKDCAFHFYRCGFAVSLAVVATPDDVQGVYLAWELTTLCSYFWLATAPEEGHQPAIRTLVAI